MANTLINPSAIDITLENTFLEYEPETINGVTIFIDRYTLMSDNSPNNVTSINFVVLKEKDYNGFKSYGSDIFSPETVKNDIKEYTVDADEIIGWFLKVENIHILKTKAIICAFKIPSVKKYVIERLTELQIKNALKQYPELMEVFI